MSKENRLLDLNALDPRELVGLRQEIQTDVSNLTQSIITLQRAAAEFNATGESIESLSDQKEGQPMLVPVTSSLFVDGFVSNIGKVLVDIGTGYFVEHTYEQGIDYSKRKVKFLEGKIQNLSQDIKNKQQLIQRVSLVLGQKHQSANEIKS